MIFASNNSRLWFSSKTPPRIVTPSFADRLAVSGDEFFEDNYDSDEEDGFGLVDLIAFLACETQGSKMTEERVQEFLDVLKHC